jgi:hypothetical protein
MNLIQFRFADDLRVRLTYTQISAVRKRRDYSRSKNQAGATGLPREVKVLLESRLARKIAKDEFDLQRRLIDDNVQVRTRQRSAPDETRLTRAYSDRRLRQRVCRTGAGVLFKGMAANGASLHFLPSSGSRELVSAIVNQRHREHRSARYMSSLIYKDRLRITGDDVSQLRAHAEELKVTFGIWGMKKKTSTPPESSQSTGEGSPCAS